ncbi:hypothetical protein TSOC_001143 [Tetrabaena socialis]|uniref:FAD-binding PCMH-type domain-containing protein n=1 Tax=Tetrabaena socialis TaxID=47790 RepID=A0A2J8AHH0_9CHLO|nr:hypothetical protein TSOC_001143 [Tetrabaena socialis]|eukprot:PNH11965.1 hypothetical protein TSOC_001143 [Tetrabaena socialis]
MTASALADALARTGGTIRAEPLTAWNCILNSDTPIISPAVPACVFTPACVADVLAACTAAARLGVKVSGRGSGHHYGGMSLVQGGLVLDLSRLNSVQVDLVTRTARVGPAASARALRAAAAPHGLHFTLPHLSDVGLGGFILGAYLGVVTELVLRLHPVPPRLRLITAVYPLEQLEQVGSFYRDWLATAAPCLDPSVALVGPPPAAANDVEGDGASGGGEGGGGSGGGSATSRAVVLLGCHSFAGEGDEATEAAYARVRALLPASRLSLEEGLVPYEEALSVLDPAWNWPGVCLYGHGAFMPVQALQGGPGGTLAALWAAAAAMTSPRSILLLAPAASAQPPGLLAAGGGGVAPSSLCFRDTLYVGLYGMWTRTAGGAEADGDAAHVAWVRSVRSALAAAPAPPAAVPAAASGSAAPPSTAAAPSPSSASGPASALVGHYVNEVMHDEPGQARLCYDGPTLARLLELKRRVDPRGLLREL